jgi:hypothetical protein
VVGDDGEHATGIESLTQQRKRRLERRNLVIHRNTNALKYSREIRRSGSLSKCGANCVHEIVTRFE